MNQRVHGYVVGPVQERVPVRVGITGLAYQCLPQWMMAGYEVVVPCVQPGQVFHLGRSGQLTSIAGLAGQHQVSHTVWIPYLPSLFQYMRQEVVYMGQVIVP